MSELRWHPFLEQWVITATHRLDRTYFPPASFCPLCPTSSGGFETEIPCEQFDIVVFENKFPSLLHPPPEPAIEATGWSPVQPAEGLCEVVVYTSQHTGQLAEGDEYQVRKLARVWQDRYRELGAKPFIKYVFIFENKGKEIGVTLAHSHGQIYAFPYLPPVPARELEANRKHYEAKGTCLHCDWLRGEMEDGRRVVYHARGFVAVVPLFARWPYEVYLQPVSHLASLDQMDEGQLDGLAHVLHTVIRAYDALWDTSLPYMMVMHQAPTDGEHYPYAHLHLEFYPPHRDNGKLKFQAGCESGAGSFINDTLPEETAEDLQRAVKKVLEESERGR